MDGDGEKCIYSQDWPDFDGDYDLRDLTAMPHCARYGRRVTPHVNCGATNCQAFTCISATATEVKLTPYQQADLRGDADRLCNLIRIRRYDDELAYKYHGNLEALASIIREHYGLLRRLDAAVRRLGYCEFAIQAGPMTSDHAQQTIRELFTRVTSCVDASNGIRWFWYVTPYYREIMPRICEVLAALERAVARFAE